jgi:hypothetical protein
MLLGDLADGGENAETKAEANLSRADAEDRGAVALTGGAAGDSPSIILFEKQNINTETIIRTIII